MDKRIAASMVRQVRMNPTPVVIRNATRQDSTHFGLRGAGYDFWGWLVHSEYAKEPMNVARLMIINNGSVMVLFLVFSVGGVIEIRLRLR